MSRRTIKSRVVRWGVIATATWAFNRWRTQRAARRAAS